MSGQSINVPGDPIAIVGIGCRFPGQANSAQAFWELLVTGTNAVRGVSPQRWDIRRYYHPDPAQPGKLYTLKGGFLERIDQFDSAFFGIPPVEATRMDPQQRLLLEVSWEALEDAGLVPGQLAGSQTGVFIGICSDDYIRIQDDPTSINAYTNAGSAISIVANRISYQFDFHGPSFAIDTACSSSLVAVHLACESLWRSECSLALAGGANILLDPVVSVGFCKAHMLSPRGQCHSFSADADGYVRGEGVGIVVLKPLSQALADKDPIYALILATGINQDGRTQGMFQPSGIAQETLLRQVYKKADILPSQVHYVEAHGTGTIIGDYVECHALGAVFGEQREAQQPLRIGSVKTNIGHLEGASGIAGLIKLALMLRHRQIPASLHFERPNPRIDFEQLKLQVQQRTETLAPAPLIAGINSFGFGGTNAHAVLQEFTSPTCEQEKTSANPLIFLLPLSARTPEALQALAASYLKLLRSADVPSLRDICFTASMRREQHTHRLALVVRSRHELIEKLDAFLAGEKLSGMVADHTTTEQNERVAFVFCGNGPQWGAMGRQLLEQEPLFCTVVEHCSQLLAPYTGWSLMEEMMTDEANSRMHRTDIAQPALFALQIALVALWKSWGIEPQAVIGHSVGEVAAAYVAGALSLEDAVYVVYQRSRLQELTAGQGTMLAVGLSEREALDLIIPYEDRVSLASINAPHSVTLSGDTATLEHITSSLMQQGVFRRFLKLNYAFHSSAMDSIRQELLASLQNLQVQSPRLPFISTVTGDEIAACDADYWWRNVRRPVQFAAGIERLIDNGITTFLEVGPHPVLSAYIAECLAEKSGHIHPSLRRKEDEQQCLLTTLGTLYTRGYPLAWHTLIADGKHVPLPFYPWQQERQWFPATADKQHTYTHPLLGYKLAAASPIWENNLEDHHLCYLADHRMQNVALFPAAGYLEMALAIAFDLFGEGSYAMKHLKIHKPLMLSNTMTRVQVVFSPEDHSFQVYSKPQQATWTTYATAQIEQLHRARPARFDLDVALTRHDGEISAPEFYEVCSRSGYQFGPMFRLLERLYLSEQDVIGVVRVPENAETLFAEYHFHPTLLDSCLQAVGPIISFHQNDEHYDYYLPTEIACFRCYILDLPRTHLYCHVHLVEKGSNYFKFDCTIFGEDGEVIAELLGLREQTIRSTYNDQFSTSTGSLYEERWQFSALCSWQRVIGLLPTPSQLNAWFQAESKLGKQEGALLAQHYREINLTQERLCVAYMIAALHQLGWNFRVGESFNPGLALQHLGIDPHYKQLLALWCMALADDGILQQTEDTWVVARTPDSVDPESFLRDLLFATPASHADLLLLTRCGRRLATILRGQVDPLAIISSNGDFGSLEHFYESGADTRGDNALVQEAFRHIIDRLPTYGSIRVLEIGAGTGGTTAHLLPLLPADRTTYVFSDVSEVALQSAQHKYRRYPFVRYELLDVGLDPQQQGFEEQSFDVIIASHVLHLTRDVHETLHHIHTLLTSEGLFFLVEPTNARHPLRLLVFGLLKDYWTFQDSALRPLQPLLSKEQWLRELSKAGFVNTTVLSHPRDVDQLNTTILLAQNPCFEQQSPLAIPPLTGASRENWIIFADDSGLAEQVQQMPTSSAEHIILVKKGTHYYRSASSSFALRPGCTEDMQLMLQTLSAEDLIGHHIVYLWGLDSINDEITSVSLDATLDVGCLSLIGIVQTLVETDWKALPHLWIITSGVYTLTATEPLPSIEQAPLYGLGRVIMNEHPELSCTLIDIGVAQEQEGKLGHHPEEIRSLVEELQTQACESEVLLRGASRFVNRIVRTPGVRQIRASEAAAMPDTRYFLDVPTPGALDNLVIRTAQRLKPVPGTVEVVPSVTGLNFKDVALAMGLLPAEVQVRYSDTTGYALGLECVGKITALGEGVTDFNVGDEVLGFGYHCFSSSVIADARLLVRKPTYMSAEEAATIVTTFVTAHDALHHLGQLRQGERVLIHGAAGGVGLAAIQIVQHAGGEIIATAGSPEKREYLRSLGIQHVLDSRSLAFADEIMQLTNGQGVHIVLNSLAGEAMRKSLSVLQRFGRFLEIGKRDFLENSKLGLQDFNRCLSYFAIDIGEMIMWDRERVTQVLHEVAERFEQGIYRPLPYRPFALSQIVDAFRYMQQSRHIGKIVVSMQDQYASVQQSPIAQVSKFRADASYLITGGLRGFGLKTAQWMVEHGARHLVLVGRSGASTAEAQQAVQEMQAAGIQVLVAQVDVTREEQVIELLERLTATYQPLRGIMHAAMVLEDRLVSQLNATTLKKVVAPKMLGAWNLHKHTLAMPLEFFVLFSSISALMGNIGQGNYAAGNLFLEALARYRAAQGLPALAVEWGALAQVGYVARNSQIHTHLERGGIQAMSPDQALTLLGRFLQEKQTQITIAQVDWDRLKTFLSRPSAMARWAHLLPQGQEQAGTSEQPEQNVRLTLLKMTVEERQEFMSMRLNKMLASILGISTSRLGIQQLISDIGIDSLTAMELRNQIHQDLGVDITMMRLLQKQSISDLATALTEQLMAEQTTEADSLLLTR
jgi:acyl transferase domain-containing protein/NADPH:quinone reductase-like Zn-dependent oxidoreductase/acyl carrier protein